MIGFAVRYYFRYKLSLRDLSELLLDRGIEVSYEAIRNWINVWGVVYAQARRKRKGSTYRDKWHVDEVRVVIKGQVFWLWRLIDADGQEIEILLQKHRNANSATRFLKKTLKLVGKALRVMVTDKLRSYGKVHRTLMKSSEHKSHKRLNNLIEESHQPTREKERQIRKFKSVTSAQKLLSSMDYRNNFLKITAHRLTLLNNLTVPRYPSLQSSIIYFSASNASHFF
ncbi:IS6 family transposase domain protein (plasmid) [Candidatus Trichorickettsia mobilis]|nr:IS6 family transposase domain protein [Candidatus Trichorickettsia mobilis]